MYKEKLKKNYNVVKDNLSMILLVPTILGGLWQVLELSSISSSFIRFFSFSQLVADGILILFLISIFSVSYSIVGSSFHSKIFKIDRENVYPLWLGLLALFLPLIAIWINFPEFNQAYEEQKLTISEIALFIFIITMLTWTLIFGLKSIFEYILKTKSDIIQKCFRKNWVKSMAEMLFKLIVLILFICLLKFIFINLNPHYANFRKSILFPELLLNKELLDKKIIKEHKLKYKPRLVYNNDKYLFYEILDNEKNKKILIVDFSTLIYK